MQVFANKYLLDYLKKESGDESISVYQHFCQIWQK